MTNLTEEVFLRIREEIKPVFYFGKDDSLPNEKVIVVDAKPCFCILNSQTLETMKAALPEYRFLHMKEYNPSAPNVFFNVLPRSLSETIGDALPPDLLAYVDQHPGDNRNEKIQAIIAEQMRSKQAWIDYAAACRALNEHHDKYREDCYTERR